MSRITDQEIKKYGKNINVAVSVSEGTDFQEIEEMHNVIQICGNNINVTVLAPEGRDIEGFKGLKGMGEAARSLYRAIQSRGNNVNATILASKGTAIQGIEELNQEIKEEDPNTNVTFLISEEENIQEIKKYENTINVAVSDSEENNSKEIEKLAQKIKEYGKDINVTVVVPEGTKNIAMFFMLCYKVNKVVVPDTVTSIGKCAFYGCQNLGEIILGTDVRSIAEGAFLCCYSLKGITIPAGGTNIEEKTCCACQALEEVHFLGSVQSIGSEAFAGSGLRKITILDGVNKIEEYAFFGCAALEEVHFSGNVKRIKRNAFAKCGLRQITIPSEDQIFIGKNVSYNFENLLSINIRAEKVVLKRDSFKGIPNLEAITFYPILSNIHLIINRMDGETFEKEYSIESNYRV